MSTKLKICFVVSAEVTVSAFLLNHLKALSQLFDLTVIISTNNPKFLSDIGIDGKLIQLPIAREINLLSDIKCLFVLIYIFTRNKFFFVHSVTPKAGLLSMLASYLCRVPNRVHTFTGQVWITKTGITRKILKNIDVLIGYLTTENIVDSPSQLDFLVTEGVLKSENSRVFGNGSIAGVDLKRFSPNSLVREEIRGGLGIGQLDVVFLFIGRLKYEKGIEDLLCAFSKINRENIHLVCVGHDEDDIKDGLKNINLNYVHFVDFTKAPESYMAASDVICLPSYREGFGMVLIEAASVGIPSIASRIYGVTDAVVDGVTGILHQPKNVDEILMSMLKLIDNVPLRLQMGEQARCRVIEQFDSQFITQEWLKFYDEQEKKIV